MLLVQGKHAGNITLDDSKLFSIYPSGMYRNEVNLTAGGKEILYLNFKTEVKSEITTSF